MPAIRSVHGRLVFNSRGSGTIEVDVSSDNGFAGRVCAPSGASVGKHEVQSFPSNDPKLALKALKENAYRFIGIDSCNQQAIYEVMREIDSTPEYSSLGGAVAFALSIAALESCSKSLAKPMFEILKQSNTFKFPFPLGNVLGGGAHAGPGTPDIQEILISPLGATKIDEAIKMNFKVHRQVGKEIEAIDRRFTHGKGDEGAWAPNMDNDRALEIVARAISECGFVLGKEVCMGIDFASSSLWNAKSQRYEFTRQGITRTTEQQIDFVNSLVDRYKLFYVEDPVNEEDFESMALITRRNKSCLITGDDMLVTNASLVKKAVNYGACSAAILKVNQAGSLYESLLFAKECCKYGIRIITSHRSGESTDPHISHIAIATDSVLLKTGIIGGERVSKLNELLRISEYGLIEGMAEIPFG
ncbi:MAG TPA: enolase C-terminal domain-like protein [Nitrososphaeraceae archaeon]